MRDDIKDTIAFLAKEDISLFNKAELARRYDCDPRTIDRYLKIQSGELIPKQSLRIYHSKLDDYKTTIINKVDIYGCTAMAVYKFIRKRGYSGKYSIVADFVKHHKDTETRKQQYDLKPIRDCRLRLTGRRHDISQPDRSGV